VREACEGTLARIRGCSGGGEAAKVCAVPRPACRPHRAGLITAAPGAPAPDIQRWYCGSAAGKVSVRGCGRQYAADAMALRLPTV
jgi:hypothetical protein